MTELYVACINTNDVLLEDHDEVALYIDDNHDCYLFRPLVTAQREITGQLIMPAEV